MNHYFIYLLTSYNHKPLYTGFTNNLERRMYEHKNEIFEGYTKKYNCKKLVYFEVFENSEAAILREKEIKGWVRKRKDELIDKHNPDWKDLTETWNQDPSAQALQDDIFLSRYTRQLALPDISMADQKRLKETHIAVIGAGGLGGAALPYLAAAGIGRITIIDHDTVSRSNLHRQTIYKDAQTGQSKADLAAAYCRDLNPDIDVTAINKKLCHPERSAQREVEGSRNKKDLSTADAIAPFAQDDNILIFDGSDNFETKTLLNQISINTQTPLISASVNQWQGQIGIFAGYAKNAPCYHCLFPDLPDDARNCNEAGILGTSAGIAGLYQAHVTLCYLLGFDTAKPGTILTFDFKSFRTQTLTLDKDPACPHCQNANHIWASQKQEATMPDLITYDDLKTKDYVIVDVRTAPEITDDPLPKPAIHMELQTVPTRHAELPKDKILAFVCAGNVRSAQAAEYLSGLGYKNVCVLDKFSL